MNFQTRFLKKFSQCLVLALVASTSGCEFSSVTMTDSTSTPIPLTHSKSQTTGTPTVTPTATPKPTVTPTVTPTPTATPTATPIACALAAGTINIRNCGAKGLGATSANEDTAALWRAVNLVRAAGSGTVYVPAAQNGGFYGFFGQGIPLPDNITIQGDGLASQIVHLNPASSPEAYKGVIFYCTDYGPYANFKQPRFSIQPALMNNTSVTLVNAADAVHFKAGQIINLGGHASEKHPNDPGASDRPFFLQSELNEVKSVSGPTLTLLYPLSTDLTLADSAPDGLPRSPQAVVLNSVVTTDSNGATVKTSTLASSLKILYSSGSIDDTPIPLNHFLAKNVKIHNLQLKQSLVQKVSVKLGVSTSLASPVPLSIPIQGTDFFPAQGPPATLIKMGAVNGSFNDLTVTAYGTLAGGNMLSRSEYLRNEVYSSLKLYDFGYSSHNLTITNYHWHYVEPPADVKAMDVKGSDDSSLSYFNQGPHDMAMDHITADGNWTGSQGIVITDGASHLSFTNWTLTLPNYITTATNNGSIPIAREALLSDDGDQPFYVHHITFQNFTFALGGIQRFVHLKEGYLDKQGNPPPRAFSFDQVTFGGTTTMTPILIDSNFGKLDKNDITIQK